MSYQVLSIKRYFGKKRPIREQFKVMRISTGDQRENEFPIEPYITVRGFQIPDIRSDGLVFEDGKHRQRLIYLWNAIVDVHNVDVNRCCCRPSLLVDRRIRSENRNLNKRKYEWHLFFRRSKKFQYSNTS